MKKVKLLFLMILVFLVAGSQAQAVVTVWDYELSGIFIDSELSNGGTLPDGTTLSWGIPANGAQSSLVIDPSTVSSQVDTFIGGGSIPSTYWADSIDLTHNNYPIYEPSLVETTLQITVILDPFIPENPALPAQTFTFDIDFTETPNIGAPEEYDVFALLTGFPNFNFFYDAGDGDGLVEYFVNVFPSTGGVLSGLTEPHASLAGVPVGTLGFATPENQSTTLGFSFTISTEPFNIPEPASLFLLGIGLIGLAGVTRKKLRKN
jgi:hypothetical protein